MSKGRRQMPQMQPVAQIQPRSELTTVEDRARAQLESLRKQSQQLESERKRLLSHQAEIAEGLTMVTANMTAVEGAILTLEFVLGGQQAPASVGAPPAAPAEAPVEPAPAAG